MNKNDLLKILVGWNFWEEKLETGTKRRFYLDNLTKFLETNQIIALTGVRRSGKSTLIKQVAEKLIESKINPNKILIVNFEDYRFDEFSLKLLDEIYTLYLERVAAEKKNNFIFLDEVQRIPKWERFVRTLHEKKEAKIIVSGSSSKLMSKELATLLTGRHINFTILPLSFKEFLEFNKIEVNNKLGAIAKQHQLKKLLYEYFQYGGFPEVVLSEEPAKRRILFEYVENILMKDIAERHNIKERQKLKKLAKFYITNASSLITFNKTAKSLDIALNTVERFSYFLQEAYLIYFLSRFSYKLKEQEKSPKKVYAIDVGISNVYGFKFNENLGNIMENIVFLELLKRKINEINMEIYYWKSQQHEEVDFVVKESLKVKQLLQVCYDAGDYNTKKREMKSLIKASEELKCKNLFIITDDYESEEDFEWFGNKRKIIFIPLWKWLLEID